MTRRPTFFGGASQADRDAEDAAHRRRGPWRRLDLIHGGRPFLRRIGFDGWRQAGLFIHRLDLPDPGRDLHDHPWAFVSLVLRGGYSEVWCSDVRTVPAWEQALAGERSMNDVPSSTWGTRRWRRWSIHAMPLGVAHRIVDVEPGTVTLVLRGRKARVWGFYQPDGWVPQDRYDYRTRRPVSEAVA